MNNEIDSLSFKIDISGLSKEQNESLKALGKALAYLSNKLKDADFTKLLDLKIPAEITPSIGDNLTSMAKGLSKVNNVLKRADFSKLAKLKAPINIFQVGKSGQGDVSQKAEELDDYNKAIKDFAEAYEKLTKAQKQVKKGKTGKTLGLNEDVKKELKDNKNLSKALKLAGVDLEEDDKKKKKSNDSKILKTLKRIKLIAFIKAIRGALNAIIKGFQTGIQQLAVYSKDFNSTMSQLSTSLAKINAGLSLTTQPIFEMLVPITQAFSDVIIELGNAISKATAQAKGLSTYTKVSSKYAKDYAQSMKQGTLFSFDTFNTLNAQQSPYETAYVDEEDTENASDLLEFIKGIKEAGQEIAKLVKTIMPYIGKILKLITPILKTIVNISNRATDTLMPSIEKILKLITSIIEVIAPIIDDILTALEPIIQAINQDLIPPIIELLETLIKPIAKIIKELPIKQIVELIVKLLVPAIKIIGAIISFVVGILEPFFDWLEPIFRQIGKIVDGIVEKLTPIIDSIGALLTNIFDGNAWKRLLAGIVKMLASIVDWFINRCIEAINLIIANDFFKWLSGGNWQGITWRSDMASNITIPELENGDFFESAPFVKNNSFTQNYVSNEAQMTRAFEQAIYNTGLIDSIENAGNISIDGKDIAQSRNFKSELNRTNPKLALK